MATTLPGASILTLFGFGSLRSWPVHAQFLMGFYVCSQVLPALFSPQPLLALPLALLKGLLVVAVTNLGFQLTRPTEPEEDNGVFPDHRFLPLVTGVILALLLSSGWTLWRGDGLLNRLSHPYLTAVSLGLLGALGLYLGVFMRLAWLPRLTLLGLSVLTLLLSGSRGPLLAALLGLGFGLLVKIRWRSVSLLLGIAALLAGGAILGIRNEIFPVARLMSTDLGSRDLIWADTLSVVRTHPLSGAGPYLLGAELTAPEDQCHWFAGVTPAGEAQLCPSWVTIFGQPWRIAHNAVLQELGESGPIGLLGLFTVLMISIGAAWATRSPFVVAVIMGFSLASIADNTLLLPSPFSGEIFWLVVGSTFGKLGQLRVRDLIWGGITSLSLCLPLVFSSWPKTSHPPVTLLFLSAPRHIAQPQGYMVFLQLAGLQGQRRIVIRSCTPSCVTLSSKVVEFNLTEQQVPTTDLISLTVNLRPVKSQTVELNLYPSKATLDARPLIQYRWKVE